MKKVIALTMSCLFFLVGCSKGVSITVLEGVKPGMNCSDLDNYFKDKDVPVKKSGNVYKVELKEDAWADAVITCDVRITLIEYNSTVASSVKHAKVYVDVQQFLLKTFEGNMIMYEEGNKIVNLGNGIKLHQLYDLKTGMVRSFKISVDSSENAKLAWNKVQPYLPDIGAGK